MNRILLICFLLFVATFPSMAQQPFVDDFTLSGDTYLTEEYCFRLTEERPYASGSIWYKRPVSLAKPFAIELTIMVGCEDEAGADGMVFAFTPQANRLGYVGEGIGFAGLVPSVGIEIDTWCNEHLGDPAEDHLAIMLNGRIGHWANLVGPVVIPNLEDCRRHSLIVRWQPEIQRLSVLIDGVERISAQHDLINQVFGGNDKVYWGMTAATGRYYNYHEVCFDRISLGEPPMNFPQQEDLPSPTRYLASAWSW
ncbi:MAG: L-type lectin-domain containing protein [Bacteroidia bacterium]|nr:L-type lectin-domain containing protein [Bacteroidia bacterium]